MNRHIFSARLLALLAIFSVLTSCAQVTATTQPPTPISSATSIPPTIELPSPTPELTSTPTSTNPVWEIKENWSPANQIRAMLIDQNGDLWTGGPAGVVHWDLKTNTPIVYAIKDDPEHTNVVGLSQLPDGMIWAGTPGNGLVRFDGNNWKSFTVADGMPSNYIIAQTSTLHGDLWVTTMTINENSLWESHLARFNGTNWIIDVGGPFDQLVTLSGSSIVGTYNEPLHDGFAISHILIFDGQNWKNPDIYPDGWINAVTGAPDETLWFATDDVVYHYVQQKWIQIVPLWAGKDFTSFSSMIVSKDGIAWFGFSRRTGFDSDQCGDRSEYDEERGVYRYDGKWWMHFTTKDGLIDNKICAITIDANDNVWFGSFDNGVSRFDGKTWTSYVIP